MIRGIGGKPFINLDPYLDIEGFKNLYYEMCYGITKSHKKEGNIVKPAGMNNYKPLPKPLYMAIDEYNSLDKHHPAKIYGKQIGEFDNRDNFVKYLKLAFGAYDPYTFVFLKSEAGGWESRFNEKPWTEDAKHFPGLVKWLQNLVDPDGANVFEYLGRIIFMISEHDVKHPLHRDIIPPETDYTDHRHEYIHIRPNARKGFYICNGPDDLEKNFKFVDCHACFFNDQDWHGGYHSEKQGFSLRIDGKFTEYFREKLGIDHLQYY